MSQDKTKTDAKPKGGKTKKMLITGVGALVLLGAGGAGGVYAYDKMGGSEAKHEDPNRPKLVLREEGHEEGGGEGEEGKEAPPKVGTVAVTSDRMKIDAKKYEATYIPLEQSFTANLADGTGFVQVGLSLSTYFDGKVVGNVKRQMVPVRSAILLVLSEQQGAFLSSAQGKEALQRQLTASINGVLREKEGFGGIENVYFTNLVIQ
jgi:flagellar protein FliL